MKIDRKKLIKLLVEKTGMETGDVETQLDQLIDRIRSAAEKGKALEIKGFGMFYFTKEGELKFDPSEDFQTEINYKYAGMEPVETRKSLDSTDEPVKEEKSEEEDLEAELEEAEPDDSIWDFDKDAEVSDETSSSAVSTPAADKGSSQKADDKKEKNLVARLITSIVAILVLVIGVIVAIDLGFLDRMFGEDDLPGEITRVEPRAGDPEEAAPEAIEDTEVGLPDDKPEELPEREQPEPPVVEDVDELSESALYGLRGAPQNIDGRFYSIILFSMRSETRAGQRQQELLEEGFRSVIAPIELEELGTMWRVGIGQFESISDAQGAVPELPENYRENHFIGLIQ